MAEYSSSLQMFQLWSHSTYDDAGLDDHVLDYFRSGNEVASHAIRYQFQNALANPSYQDAYGVTHISAGKHGLFISSPNVDFVPDLPSRHLTEDFCYYADGMLGPFEHLKWPQAFDVEEPHHIAAPINPFFFRYSDALTDCPEYPSRAAGNAVRQDLPRRPVPELDVWQDPEAPWTGFPHHHWRSDPFSSKTLGQLSPSATSRLRAAYRDAVNILRTPITRLGEDTRYELPRRYIDDRQLALARAICTLEFVLPLQEALQWFREAQRLLLEIRAWYNFMAVIKPRIEAYRAGKGPKKPYPPLPLRGVFTARRATAETLYWVGVPVWWARHLYTFNSRTRIGFPVDPVPWQLAFSTSKQLMLGHTNVIAPDWTGSFVLDSTALGYSERLRRLSMFRGPPVRKPAPILPESIEEEEHPESSQPSVASTSSNPAPARRKGVTAGKSARRMEPPARADWLPPVHPAWVIVEQRVQDIATPMNTGLPPFPQLLYGLPPQHAFGGQVANKIHHWLRMRAHCYYALVSQDGDAGVPMLLNPYGWRLALDGHYYRFPVPDTATPKSTPEQIKKLPTPPDVSTNLGKRKSSTKTGKAAPATKLSTARRLAEQIDIAVHFNVINGVPPYNPGLKPWPQWRGSVIDRSRVETDQNLWREVVWELVTVHFRMELIWFDQEVMAESQAADAKGDAGKALDMRLQRFNKWSLVWRVDGGLLVGRDSADDLLLSTDWTYRRAGVSRMSALVSHWPGMDLQPMNMGDSISTDLFVSYEQKMYEKYCRFFYKRKGRLPVLPLACPLENH
ncbi:hypothetical protein FA95DRAFT_1612178 [Auriscalpium vulgare]|uniref:Uncharacterized protein n=1 Tax=Auriscalpium vulgare TaxID=40419 RepID=A0ACB8R726_9AGAM|nr:hypothetical protein FA95DRAFT_1612178 [Auriscalpium vulgare]